MNFGGGKGIIRDMQHVTVLLTVMYAFLCLASASALITDRPPSSDWQSQHSPSSPAILALLPLVHARQHPTKSACRGTRFLVTQLDDEHFEGLGSILGEIAGALGEAMHANRTLVWGVGLPYLFDKTRDEWASQGGSVGAAGVFGGRGGLGLDCSSWEGLGGGAWACFFRSLSSCSLEDATFAELVTLGEDPYNDSARLKLQEHRRGVSLYTLPSMSAAPDLYAAASIAAHPRHAFAASLMAFLFRLKPSVAKSVEKHRIALWSGAAGVSCPPNSAHAHAHGVAAAGPVWTMHVRRGDVARNIDTYGNRHLFSYGDFYLESKKKAIEIVASGGAAPTAIFIASDGAAAEWITGLCNASDRLKEMKSWPGGVMPRFFTPSPADRYLTPYGSHTAAADGACRSDCSLQAEDVLALRAAAALPNAVPPAQRMMRVLADATEDLALLSSGDVFFGQASSFFSTTAMFLTWASRAGGADFGSVCMPDAEGVANGAIQTGLLSAGLNGTQALSVSRGHERWIAVTKRFIGSLEASDSADCGRATRGYLFGCDVVARRMALVDLLPLVPPNTFISEAARWLGAPGKARVWKGECPMLPRPPAGAAASKFIRFAEESFLHGEGHTGIAHQGQALACWADAVATLREVLRVGSWVSAGAGATTALLSKIEQRVSGYRAFQVRQYTTPDGISRGLSRNVRPHALPPSRAPPSSQDTGVSDADAALPAGAIYEPIHLDCACGEGVGKGRALLIVGWKGIPSSYAAVAEGLMLGFAAAAAGSGSGSGSGNGDGDSDSDIDIDSGDDLTVDFLAAPAYKKAWEWMHVEGAVSGVSAGGMASRMAIYRLDSQAQDHLVPPALYNVKPARNEHVARMGGPLPARRGVDLQRKIAVAAAEGGGGLRPSPVPRCHPPYPLPPRRLPLRLRRYARLCIRYRGDGCSRRCPIIPATRGRNRAIFLGHSITNGHASDA